jgi:hypothetical protein
MNRFDLSTIDVFHHLERDQQNCYQSVCCELTVLNSTIVHTNISALAYILMFFFEVKECESLLVRCQTLMNILNSQLRLAK